MFKTSISEEAILDFCIKYGHCEKALKMYVDKTYVKQFKDGSVVTAPLIGYAPITGLIPKNNPWALVYEPSIDTYFVPVRYADDDQIFFFGYIGFSTGPGPHLDIETLWTEDVQALKDGVGEALFVSTPTKLKWRIVCRKPRVVFNVQGKTI